MTLLFFINMVLLKIRTAVSDVDKCHPVAVIPLWQVGMVEYQENNGGVDERGLVG